MSLFGPAAPVGFLTLCYSAQVAEAGGIFQGKTFVALFKEKQETKNGTDCLETTKASGEDFGASKKFISYSRIGAGL